MKLIEKLMYAYAGVHIALRQEQNFRIELALFLTTLLAGIYFCITTTEWIAIFTISAVVLSIEIINTAFEEICDKFHPDHDPHIEKIKDLAAGAVLIIALGALSVGILIFIPYILKLWI
ncbi:MAG: diacylglycerol kinase family protein [Minisyncoccia bacterium]